MDGARFANALKTDLFDESCGPGMVPELQRSARKIVGIDISKSITEQAAKRNPALEAKVGDVREMPFASGSIDFVFSNSTLDHFEQSDDIEKSITEIARVLAPRGSLLLTLDNPLNPVVWVRNKMPSSLFGRTLLAPYFVGHTLSLGPMVRLLESCGFEIRRKGHILHVPRIVVLHLCRFFDPSESSGRLFLRFMLSFENLAHMPTAPLTGHFTAALAIKKP
jgi:SAM-dependent methyltransferase